MGSVANGFDLPESIKAVIAIEDDLRLLTSALTDAQFHAPPRTGGWSVGYCIEHLVLTGQAFLSKWDLALKEAAPRSRASNGALRYGWFQRWLLRRAEPPYKVRSKTTQAFLPCSRRPMDET